MYAAAHDITADAELLYVSAMLHDIGLTEAFDTYRTPFEVAGGDLAWVFSVAAGWPPDRAARAPEIIVLHMRDDVCATVDPESHLLQVATAWDVAGCRPEGFSPDARACRRSLSPARIRRRVSGVLPGSGQAQAAKRRCDLNRQRCRGADCGEPARLTQDQASTVFVRNFPL